MTASAERMREAARIIARDGLTKGRLVDCETGARCAVGALQAAVDAQCVSIDAVREETDFLADMLGGPVENNPMLHDQRDRMITRVTRWNDELERTDVEVVELLLAAAEKLEADR